MFCFRGTEAQGGSILMTTEGYLSVQFFRVQKMRDRKVWGMEA